MIVAERDLYRLVCAPRPFIGFGDPSFGGPEGNLARRIPDQVLVGATTLTFAPGAKAFRLWRTRDASCADSLRASGASEDEVFLGPGTTEAAVRSLDLSVYRTVALATHALVAGEFQGIVRNQR